jgi:hypothetical protein
MLPTLSADVQASVLAIRGVRNWIPRGGFRPRTLLLPSAADDKIVLKFSGPEIFMEELLARYEGRRTISDQVLEVDKRVGVRAKAKFTGGDTAKPGSSFGIPRTKYLHSGTVAKRFDRFQLGGLKSQEVNYAISDEAMEKIAVMLDFSSKTQLDKNVKTYLKVDFFLHINKIYFYLFIRKNLIFSPYRRNWRFPASSWASWRYRPSPTTSARSPSRRSPPESGRRASPPWGRRSTTSC